MRANVAGTEVDFTSNPYNNPDTRDLPAALINGPWRPEIKRELESRSVRALFLNSARGWQGEDLDFLIDLYFLEEVHILIKKRVDVRAIEKLTWVTALSLTVFSSQKLDLTLCSNLRDVFLTWWPGVNSIFQHEKVKYLRLDQYKSKAKRPLLYDMPPKERIAVYNSNIQSLDFLKSMPDLKRLSIAYCNKISDFSPIGYLKGLERLEIIGCTQLETLDFVSTLSELQVLNISETGEFNSVEPLRFCKNLRAFAFPGEKTKARDGDLSPLEDLPKLSMLMFAPRSHYTHNLVKGWSWENFDRPDRLLERKSEG